MTERIAVYTMTEAMSITGLGRTPIQTLHKLNFINLDEGIGAGVKRISEEDLVKLRDAAALLRFRHRPEHVVEILLHKEKYLALLQTVIQMMAQLEEDPKDKNLWRDYVGAMLEFASLDEEEKIALSSALLGTKNQFSGPQNSRYLDRAYQKIGYAFMVLIKLKTL